MNPALWVSKTGLDAQQTRMQVIANNLANVNTTGFKRSRAVFEDLLYQNVRQVGAASSEDTALPSGLMLGTGVRTVATEKIFSQGNVLQTDNPLDMSINGRGFFQILRPDGSMAYTRTGSFQLNDAGEMVDSSGMRLEPGITIPPNTQSITIGQDGAVTVQVAGTTEPQNVGTIQIADFINPAGLQPIGENLYLPSAASGDAQVGTPNSQGLGAINQATLESSNVNIVEELVNMIETQRAYEVNSKSVSTTDKMLQYLNQTL
ncbi:MAG: flagellar basal-body rod protein FlgG [Gammaproteobacteria bacterium]|nr:flagellar basal-body rod protein FlgG [Gammaproteobacteria bacterium]